MVERVTVELKIFSRVDELYVFLTFLGIVMTNWQKPISSLLSCIALY